SGAACAAADTIAGPVGLSAGSHGRPVLIGYLPISSDITPELLRGRGSTAPQTAGVIGAQYSGNMPPCPPLMSSRPGSPPILWKSMIFNISKTTEIITKESKKYK
ncbi:MAG: hypothetical protein ABF917_11075, partial [Gluconobacter oxydans]|uniref:hypothetical protein n=1 Tax=Gluconobacter oxydans TaxID=442 RepID=UPI0039E964F2